MNSVSISLASVAMYTHTHINHSGMNSADQTASQFMLWLPLIAVAIPLMLVYIGAAYWTSKTYRSWSKARCLLACAGIAVCAAAVTGPLAQAAHHSFSAHMLGHLLLGMLGPLLLVYAAPMTLLLRTLPRQSSRFLSKILRSRIVMFIAHPVSAAILNVGGLWVLYHTDLFTLMHRSNALYVLIHIHVFAAGYLFTASLLPVDPAPHKVKLNIRVAVMIMAFAAHGILSKTIYAFPPAGVPNEEAQFGAQLMYYGGDAVDLILIILLGYRWYRSAGKETSSSPIFVRKTVKKGIHR
ncbi:cytochrome c oxidase assembly protein [Saccharibacillus sp. JS10]|uniref:cytochrome c oxidase assembly protein n=1 Tax=Saccharibacillus sp. JS10 TaxID=2950552 RepID=UPI0021098661|nr:cytochrome c oxidase assembly protein [Saccharibacillus sp. JS10]MCQ4085662.1 cytochrome c oxidase assembly protein [Saccharibacillus sp. JS10]